MSSIAFMIPALNEERRIGATLETVLGVVAAQPGLQAQLLVVDDGSTDATGAIVAQFARQHPEVTLLSHDRNRGLGQALRTALGHTRAENLLIVPGDNDMPASSLATLLAHAGEADLIMCFFPDRADRGKARRVLSAAFGLIYAIFFRIDVQYINGPCIYPVARLRQLKLFSNRFSIVAEMNVKLLRQGVTFFEIGAFRQTRLEGSTSFSWRNLRETMAVFLRLCWEIHWKERDHYRSRPRRIRPNLIPLDARRA